MPNSAPSPAPPLSAGGIAMIIFGGLLLLFPGGCSLIFSIMALAEKMSSRPDQYGFATLALVASSIGFLIAALGFWLIRAGLRRRRQPAPPRP